MGIMPGLMQRMHRTFPVVAVAIAAAVLGRAAGAAAGSDELAQLAARQRQLAHAAERAPTAEQRRLLRQYLGEVNWRLLLDPRWMDGKIAHTVQRGESLHRIARRYGVTPELLRMCNGLTNDALAIGAALMVPTGAVAIVVDKSDNLLTVSMSGVFLREFAVATGVDNCTPEGSFTITDRVERPTWWRPSDNKPIPYGDPEHELGTHWLAWSIRGYGIHGTNRPETIGTQASRGCVRMRNEDVADLFALAPVGTPVTVRD